MLIFELTIILSLHTNFPHPQIYLVFRNGNVDNDNDYSFVIHTNVSLFLRYTVVSEIPVVQATFATKDSLR